MNNLHKYQIRIAIELWTKVQQVARKHRLSVNSLVLFLLESAVKELIDKQ